MANPPKPKPWVALSLPHIKAKPKRVVEDERFYVSRSLSQRQIEDLDRIRGLIAIGGELGPFYRRSKTFDELLSRQQVLHLHLGGPGSDAILYLIQYPGHVLFLCVDGHVHLDDIPPGKGIQRMGRRTFERGIEEAERQRLARVRTSVKGLLLPRPPK